MIVRDASHFFDNEDDNYDRADDIYRDDNQSKPSHTRLEAVPKTPH